MEFKRNVKCVNCGNEVSIYLSGDLTLTELLINGKCPRCNGSMQLNFNIVESGSQTTGASSGTASDIAAALPTVPIDDSMMGSEELPSDAIRDLIEG